MDRKSRLDRYQEDIMSDDFIDALSRKERKQFKKRQEQIKQDIIERTQEIKKLENDNFRKQLNNSSNKRYDNTEKIINEKNKLTRENSINHQNNVKKKKSKLNIFTNFILLITIILGIIYLGYNIYISNQLIDQVYTILNSGFITAIIILFSLSVMFNKEKTKKAFSILTAFIFIEFLGFNGLVSMNYITLPKQATVSDFTNKSINNVIKWATDNKIDVIQTQEYSDSIKANNVISQNIEANTLVKDINEIEVITSSGPNPETIVNLPDMVGWTVDEVVKEIENEKLTNVKVEFEFSELTRDTVINQSKSGAMRRNDEITIIFSLGLEEDLKPVKLINLINKTEFKATLWLKRNGIKYEINREFSDNIKKGKIISTTPKEGVTIKQSETILKLVISKGKKIVVPDLMNMSMDDIVKWATDNNINIIYNSDFDSTVKKGKIKAISVKKDSIIEEDSSITITTSKGALKMINYTNTDIEKIRTFALTYKINLNETTQFSTEVESGKIISVSKKPGENVETGETIDMVISTGSSIKVPDFTGMNLSNAKSLCSSNKLDCSVSYTSSSKTKGTVVGQNKRSGSEVVEGTSVILIVSNGTSSSSSSNYTNTNNNYNYSSSSSNNNSSSTKPKPTPTPVPTCNKTTFYIYPHYIAINYPTTTCSNVKSAYPGYKISCSYVNSDSGKMGQILNSSSLNGKTISSCENITIQIKNN